MMPRIAAATLACLLLAVPNQIHASDALSAADAAKIDAVVRREMVTQHRPSVVIAINRNGKRVFARAWGVQNVASDIPANIDTVYQYGSITKQFTAMAIFLLAQDGKLDLDDRIGKYLSGFGANPARIREMLVHTSGLADPSETVEYVRNIAPVPGIGTEWVVTRAEHGTQAFAPGTKTAYNNTAYTALARVVERASGMSFDDFLQKRIIDVVGMRRAHPLRELQVEPNAARGYMWWEKSYAEFLPDGAPQGAVTDRLVNALPWNLRQVDGAGYLVGDVDDLQRWDDALLSGLLLHGKWRQLYLAPGALANGTPAFASAENPTSGIRAVFCNGGMAKVTISGHVAYLANGGTMGFSTFTGTIPDRHVSVTMLSNVRSSGNDAITIPLMKLLAK